MPDVSIVNQSVTAVPDQYTVPGAQAIGVKAVRASIDGSGAASTFLPALQLLDPAGHVMWTAVDTSKTVAAGGSADVSWFPGLGGGGGASTAFAQWFYANRSTSVTMPAQSTDTIPWDSLQSSDSSLFSLGTTVHPNDSIVISRVGVLVASAYLVPTNFGGDFSVGIGLLDLSWGQIGANTQTPIIQFNRDGLPGGNVLGLGLFGPRDVMLTATASVPDKLTARYRNFDTVNSHNLLSAQIGGFFWPTATAIS